MELRKISSVLIVAPLLFMAIAAACSNGTCKLLDDCETDGDCEAGLQCFSCPQGFLGSKCVRSKATPVFNLLNNSLPFNKYAFLTTHNAFAIDDGTPRVAPTNQEDSITQQLNEPAIDALKEIEAFLSANPNEIVTIILEDYVQAPNGLTQVFTNAGLMKYWFPITSMPQGGQDWPLVKDMVANNQRLLVFGSVRSKEQSEGIAYQWNYMVENQYGNDGMKAGECPNRAESSPMNDQTKSLVLVNYFRTLPLKRSEGGGTFQAVDLLNGERLCGCNDVHACVPGGGSCTP
ncbi:hypothetical protein Ccrd_005330 [Cynara cardunculus var. scolymus]|uniref:PLC-like phosphodiesterase, TIM beta/alpha-barrel domain-containing protein n=1 Tax=Cynara cardunculus var. scolymus TaxID=59895 RepID=A0A118JUL4_CYNCS|nr:hypothetical protein Ccrd_005330 [Cynara cardunculus var. scolymus]